MRAALSALVLLAACRRGPPPLASCADDVSGIWSAADGRRFQIVDRRERVEVYALFDTTGPDKAARPWRTPAKTELERRGAELHGRTFFQAQGTKTCTITTPARLEECDGDRAVLAVELQPVLDPTGCAALPAAPSGVEIRRM